MQTKRRMQGLLHHYAQMRYEALTGWKAPIAGGPRSESLNDAFCRFLASGDSRFKYAPTHDALSILEYESTDDAAEVRGMYWADPAKKEKAEFELYE